jgi:quinoprotein glucose dehydrogenase
MLARIFRPTVGLLVLLVCGAMGLSAQEGENIEWRSYAADLSSSFYSPAAQINADNFNDLEVAWRFSTRNLGPTPEANLQSTPLMIGGVLYSTAGSRRSVIALDATTGELLWMHRLDEGERAEAAPRRLSGRGLAYWDDGDDGTIFYVTTGYQLVALDAGNGRRVQSFGTDGIVDLKREFDQDIDLVTGEVGLHAAPVVANNTIVIGAAHRPGTAPKSRENVQGHVRGYDTRTGARKWIFHTIPQNDEYGNDSWLNDSWQYTGNTGVWAQISIDPELNMAYLPVECPTGDYYGGHRLGDNLFANSIVAVDLDTGERVWHYQVSHHDVWDWDLPAAPILGDITVDGREIKAVAVPTKQAWIFVFDRETGEPVWPIEERPVEQSMVPGEILSPTQPFPTKPPAIDRQGIGVDDLIDFTPELRAAAEEIASKYTLGPIYTPPTVADPEKGNLGTLIVPAATGGVNWPGGALDPETGVLYQYTKTQVTALRMVNDPERSDMDYISSFRLRGVSPAEQALTVEGLPLLKPPWARITAVDLNKGEIVWQIPHGETPDNVRNHPKLQGLDIPRTGRVGRIGTLVTKTLVVAGEGGFFTTPEGANGAMLRAYDKATGEEVGAVFMEAPQTGTPMTYVVDGTQYLVIAIGGSGRDAELVAYRLPS